MMTVGSIEKNEITSIPTFRAAYSDRTALLMAKIARSAYEKFDACEAALRDFSQCFSRLGFSECVELVHAQSGTAGFIVANEDLIIVAFRGTEDLRDWLTDVTAEWTVLKGGVRVHTGFFRAYSTIRERMFMTITRLLAKKPRPVYLTGHSLGGALACMATAELANADHAQMRDCIAACYTFGCPRAGDASFDWYVKVPLYRVTNGSDVVPTIPPAFMGYRHVGDARYFGNLGEAPLRGSPDHVAKMLRTLAALPRLLRLEIKGITDHSIDVYVAKLYAWAQNVLEESRVRRIDIPVPQVPAEATPLPGVPVSQVS